MKRKLKIYLPILMGVIAAICIAAVVYGAGNANDKVNNRMQVPAVEGIIDEEFKKPDILKPGLAVPKKVGIKNDGTTAMFVRVMALPEIKTAAGVLLPASTGNQTSDEAVQVDLGSAWKDGKDGYYYYTQRIEKGTSIKGTDPLFTEVKLNSSLGNEYIDATFTMQIKIETVSAVDLKYRKVWWGLKETDPPTPSALVSVDNDLKAKAGH